VLVQPQVRAGGKVDELETVLLHREAVVARDPNPQVDEVMLPRLVPCGVAEGDRLGVVTEPVNRLLHGQSLLPSAAPQTPPLC
jgi:hypothetical protein